MIFLSKEQVILLHQELSVLLLYRHRNSMESKVERENIR